MSRALVAAVALGAAAAAGACESEERGSSGVGFATTATAPPATTGAEGTTTTGTGPQTTPLAKLDKKRARETYVTTTDLMRWVFAPTCAAQKNECHFNEDFPDLSTEGNLWNLVDLPCNLGVGDRTTVEDFCEPVADELKVAGAANARIGSIATVTDDQGVFAYYEVRVEVAPAAPLDGASFVVVRGGQEMPALGEGSSLQGDAGSTVLRILAAADIPDPGLVRQGDENQNGMFGAEQGVLVRAGNAHGSYLVRRLLGKETERPQMPLNENADNPTEVNRALDPDATYALLSWIVCMQPGDGPYSPIRYDCPANAGNEGAW